MGLITGVVPAGELDSAVDAVLKSLTAKSPIGMKIGKEAFHAAENMELEDALDYLSGKTCGGGLHRGRSGGHYGVYREAAADF
ncbi:MAG: hypothetical protein MZV70_10705 [Desulfobacterales bacterium]|nr:hypothetical protein [Desulfobacterales bacterium]